MGHPRLLRGLFYIVASAVALAILGAEWAAIGEFRLTTYARVQQELHSKALLVEAQIPRPLDANLSSLQRHCHTWSRLAQARITVISPSGKVLADSEADPTRMENHADRSEFRDALVGRPGTSIRYSYTLRERMVYAAVPIRSGGQIAGAVRVASSVGQIDQAIRALRARVILMAGTVAILAVLAAYVAMRRAVRPWFEVERAAERFAAGDLGYRLSVHNLREARPLGEALNRMAAQLADRLRVLTEERNAHEALLASMVEGVLALDAEERILVLNDAAAQLLQVDPVQAQGRLLAEAIRNASLLRFVRQVLAKSEPIEDELILRDPEDRFLQMHGTALRDAYGHRIGALVVMHDVTRLRRLEIMRRDFVANASHELRTPITSIRGFVETLRDGALDRREDAERFLEIIARQSERLEAIINDLLMLSRLEHETERHEIARQDESVKDILEAAIQDCQDAAEKRNVQISLDCSPDLRAYVNRELLEQAVVNLIDNAIKHGTPHATVTVAAEQSEEELVIRVRDQGPGIDPEHLPRLFERFYRVDRARSRQLGGTGLGLAIVKHIAQADHGRVTVESVRGQGSTFSICIPRRSPSSKSSPPASGG